MELGGTRVVFLMVVGCCELGVVSWGCVLCSGRVRWLGVVSCFQGVRIGGFLWIVVVIGGGRRQSGIFGQGHGGKRWSWVGQGLCFLWWLGAVNWVFRGWDWWVFVGCNGCRWW